MTLRSRCNIICHDVYDSVYRGLKIYEDAGIPLFLEDEQMSATAIAEIWTERTCGTYMLDFIPDPSGLKLCEIRLDLIDEYYGEKPKNTALLSKRQRDGAWPKRNLTRSS